MVATALIALPAIAFVLAATPFVAGTFGDLVAVGVVFVTESGLRIGVVFLAANDAEVEAGLVAGLYKSCIWY